MNNRLKGRRLFLSQPHDWAEAFEAQAKKDGKSLSEWIGEQCLKALPAKVRKELSERPAAHRPRKYSEQ